MLLHKRETTCFSSSLCVTGKAMRMNVVVPSQTLSVFSCCMWDTKTLPKQRKSPSPFQPLATSISLYRDNVLFSNVQLFYANEVFWTLGQFAEFSHHYLFSKESEGGVERCDYLFYSQLLCDHGDGGGHERGQVCDSVPPCMLWNTSTRIYEGAVAMLTSSTLFMLFQLFVVLLLLSPYSSGILVANGIDTS